MSARGGAFWSLIGAGLLLRTTALIGSCAAITAVLHTLLTGAAGRLVATWYLVLPALALIALNLAALRREIKLSGPRCGRIDGSGSQRSRYPRGYGHSSDDRDWSRAWSGCWTIVPSRLHTGCGDRAS
ncbi:hypothetical protein BAY59_38135 [Prauserella coralliicola]|uniref:Uncharacterized protein n=1 Tax=Prauserella flavalba TaxID=1477506 RepID=A0A318LLX1_9PSEU|nr:hypothetical protein BAY59_38135 [Prauserella coralliicola]PXY17477.1 hypothetical protein BA062_37460 [Prauserella flavalba]